MCNGNLTLEATKPFMFQRNITTINEGHLNSGSLVTVSFGYYFLHILI